MPVRRILNPVDFSEVSSAASKKAAELAQACGAELIMLHVIAEPAFSVDDGSGYPTSQLVQEYEQAMRQRLAAAAHALRDGGHEVKELLVWGRPHEAIHRTVQSEQADLIVLGTHGRGAVGRVLVGSIAERVVRTAQVPVLSVRG